MARILVIDDEPIILMVCSRVLQRAGHSVVEFQHGQKAIAYLGQRAVDLVITDIFMPEMEGLDVIKQARRLKPGIPILAMSGGGSVQAMEYLGFSRRFGATATLDKPFTPAELTDAVGQLLRSEPAC